MKKKALILNIGLMFFSIYIPMLLFSLYALSNDKSRSLQREEFNLKISAAKKGYKPIFYPDQLLQNDLVPKQYPIGSLPLTPTYDCDEGYGLIKYTTDRFGLRNKDENWNDINKKSNLFLIGDSFAHGSCVNENYSIAGILRIYKKKNIINLASPSNSPHEYKAIIKLVVDPIIKNSNSSNTVIIIFYANDYLPYKENREKLLNDTKPILIYNSKKSELFLSEKYIKDLQNYIVNNYPQSSDEIVKKIKLINRENLMKIKNSKIFYTFSLLPLRRKLRYVMQNLNFKMQDNKKLLSSRESIKLLSESCKNLCDPIIVYIPPSNYWSRYLHADSYKDDLRKISNEFNIQFINGEEVINKNKLEDYSPVGAHLSIKGYKKIAELINESTK